MKKLLHIFSSIALIVLLNACQHSSSKDPKASIQSSLSKEPIAFHPGMIPLPGDEIYASYGADLEASSYLDIESKVCEFIFTPEKIEVELIFKLRDHCKYKIDKVDEMSLYARNDKENSIDNVVAELTCQSTKILRDFLTDGHVGSTLKLNFSTKMNDKKKNLILDQVKKINIRIDIISREAEKEDK
jgi:hypothetical protein